MSTMDSVLERVRRVDPIREIDLYQWGTSAEARRVFDFVVSSSVVGRPRRHRARWLAGGAVVVTGAFATAAAASGVLGGPAPDPIRAHLAALDDGLPQDLRLNPDVEHAMAVASTASGVLYAADLKEGGYCIEIATEGDRPRGAACVTAARVGDRAIEVTAPIPSGPTAALLVGGRINDSRVERVVVRYPDGTSNDVVLGLARYWLVEVPDSVRSVALTDGVQIAGVDAGGLDVSTLAVPPLRDEDPDGTALDRAQPVFVSTISTGDDLTLVLGVEGSVNAAGATTLELEYPGGTSAGIALAPDGSYRFMIPPDRQSDFESSSGKLIARDASGQIVASVSFSSVANSQRNP
ncbi:MAG: hypothetical protein ABI706_17105 [Ilumatobacteraceae bacterium]